MAFAKFIRTVGRTIQQAYHVHQRGLTRAARTHDCHKLTGFNHQSDLVQRNSCCVAEAVQLADVLQFNYRHIVL